ncbi:MAG: histidine kinase, partial [Bacteroidota bacterium]|nr:histidine kinase [Bacteroidota bacterium]
SRFDGISFQNYTLAKLGLTSYISSLTTTEDGKIILGSGSSGIFSFDPVSEQLIRINKSPILRSNQIIIKNDLLVSLHENRGFDFLSMSTGEILFADTIFSINSSIKALSMFQLNDGTILLGRSDGLYQLKGMNQKRIEIFRLGKMPIYSIFEKENSIMVGGDGKILKILNKQITDTIHLFSEKNNMIRNINEDSRGNIWFNVWGQKDLFMIAGNTIINVSEKARINTGTITGIYMEPSGTIWTSGIGKGIHLFTNNHLLIYPESENLPNSNILKIVRTPNGGFLIGTDDGLAYLNPDGNNINGFKHIQGVKQYIKSITSYGGNQYLVATIDNNFSNSFSSAFSCAYENINIRYSHCSSILIDSLKVLTGNWDNKIMEFRLPKMQYKPYIDSVFYSTSNTHRINCMITDQYGRLWIGSQKGLCLINAKSEKFFPGGSFQRDEISSIRQLQGDSVFVVTNTGFYYLKNSTDAKNITIIKKTSIQGTNCVAITGQNEFLIGTSYGLLFWSNNKQSLMTLQDGILSENINEIYYDDSKSVAWVGTSEGLLQVDMHELRHVVHDPLTIREINFSRGNVKWLPENENIFKYDANTFRLKFQAFHYNNPHKIKYQYKVDDGEWLNAPSNEIQFASLIHGDHLVSLRAGLTGSAWGPAKSVNIIVLPPFYYTWWFYLVIFVAGTGLIFLIVKNQVRTFKKRQHEKITTQQKIVEFQQKALASNLNPHFVFNSLNAIQHFINSKSPAEANEYLAKFARLMRMHLNMAEKNSILLHEEIQRLEYYLSLEQMRFDDKMEWVIEVDPELDTYHLEIPNMIIQPFVENAIWHGIMPSTSKGKITLSIKKISNGHLQIIITDNGVGFNHQANNDRPGHESKGTRLIKERLLLLDSSVEEVVHFTHLNPGTRVIITLTAKMHRDKDVEASVSHL